MKEVLFKKGRSPHEQKASLGLYVAIALFTALVVMPCLTFCLLRLQPRPEQPGDTASSLVYFFVRRPQRIQELGR
ncbi:MAG: hypothetical protein HC878_13885 [Leptolyngbyaceae cyanobacterium SL_5_14]|nr:hypothetical protein [Leptolyngbyaceae cyanobacterium SL_5_14]